MVSSMVKEPEDLIDRDLLNLLGFIKKQILPKDEEINSKIFELGEIT